ncbi:MAG: uracil-DNA glycosylase [Endomicrobiia bacterium]
MKEENKKKLTQLFKLASILYSLDGLYIDISKNLFNDNNPDDKFKKLEKLKLEVKKCRNCNLYQTRTNVVFGEGNINAELMFIGEAPGYEEDKQARPFVGKAGELLNKIIQAMNLNREEVYITNVVKCHPVEIPDPQLRNNDRPPTLEEIKACINYLHHQIEIISPKVICCLGSIAAKTLTGNDVPISELRGKIFEYKYSGLDIKVIPTYHPAALLRNPSLKPYVWKDMKLIMKILGIHEKK